MHNAQLAHMNLDDGETTQVTDSDASGSDDSASTILPDEEDEEQASDEPDAVPPPDGVETDQIEDASADATTL